MKKLAVILLTVAVALSILGWIYARRSSFSSDSPAREQHRASVPEERQEKDVRENVRAKEDNDRDPEYLNLPVWYAMKLEDKKARIGYWNARKKTFYAWKEVLVPIEDIPGIASPNARAEPLDLTKIHVIEIDPLVFYLQRADDSFAPGYYSRWQSGKIFYEWKGVTIARRQIPDAAVKRQLLRNADIDANRPVKAPEHRLRESKTWKKD